MPIQKHNGNGYRYAASRFTVLLCVFFLVLSGANLCAEQPSKLFLWEIKGTQPASYLCGSVHVMSRDQFPLPKAIEDAFDRSATLVVEADIIKAAEEVLDPSLMNKLYYEGKTLMDVLPPDLWERTETSFAEFGAPLIMFNAFRPWVIATTLVQFKMQQLGYDPSLGLDYYFLRQAYDSAKQIKELESADFQITMMSGLPDDLQITLLEDSLADMEGMNDEMKNLFITWQEGDTEGMNRIIENSRLQGDEADRLYDIILTGRNKQMAGKIASYLKTEKSCFIIIGAGHFVGKGSVLEELEQFGYSVRQMDR